MRKPKVSIIIATLNSERTLRLSLESVKKQTLPKNKLEILVVDGGSKDRTLEIAKKYKCRVIKNVMVDPLNAKYLGFLKAKGRYLVGLDHDEVFRNKKSLETRIKIFKNDRRVKALHSSGYITPKGSNPINYYVNEYGDPFSFFIYRLTKDYRFFTKCLKERYKIAYEDENYLLIKTSFQERRAPLMEVLAGGGMVDVDYVKKKLKRFIFTKELFLPHLHLHLLSVNPYIAVMKNDPLYHYSAESIGDYLRKLDWRVRNNIYFGHTSGSAGYLKREEFEGSVGVRKFYFIPYSLLLIPALIDSLVLSVSRGNLYYLIHLPLSVITSFLIIYHSIMRIIGFKPILTSYGGTSKITKKWQ